jgi:hypothetical protein
VSDGVIGEIGAFANRFETSVKLSKGLLEEVRLNFSKFIELNEGILKYSLIIFLKSLSNDSSHVR